MHGVSRVNYFGLIGSLGVTIAFIYTPVGWKMLPRTADIIHGFCISPGEISSTTWNLLFRPVVVAQICGLFHDASSFSRWNSVSTSLFFPFFHFFFLFPSFVSFYPFQSSTRVDTLLLSTADDFIGIEGSAQGVSWRFRPFLYSFYPRVLLNTPPPVDETHSKGNSSLRHRYLENIWMRGKENGKAVWLREFTARALHYNDL